jgi:hypothetical protein
MQISLYETVPQKFTPIYQTYVGVGVGVFETAPLGAVVLPPNRFKSEGVRGFVAAAAAALGATISFTISIFNGRPAKKEKSAKRSLFWLG